MDRFEFIYDDLRKAMSTGRQVRVLISIDYCIKAMSACLALLRLLYKS